HVHNRDHAGLRRAFENLRACEVLDSTQTDKLRFRGSVLLQWLKRQVRDGQVRVRIAPTQTKDTGHGGIFIDHENLIKSLERIQARRGGQPADRLEWFRA